MNFFQLLGVSSASAAADRWPRTRVQGEVGSLGANPDPADFHDLMTYLNEVLSFRNVLPGAAVDPTGVGPRRVGLHAEVVVDNQAVVSPLPLVLHQMPDVAFHLIDTAPGRPARLFVTQSDAGVEAILEGLPVEIKIPSDLLGPLPPKGETLPPSGEFEIRTTPDDPLFEAGTLDSLEVMLRSFEPSSIKVHVRVRMTEEGEFVVEPAVPLSIGPCTFVELPCQAIHDLALLPAPYLTGHEVEEVAIEWARHRLDRWLDPENPGVYTVRTLDLDTTRAPLDELVKRLKSEDPVELVLEDVALPIFSLLLPYPTHGRAGLRRVQVQADEEAMTAWDHTLAPIHLDFGDDYRLKIFRLLIQTPADDALRDVLDASLALVRLERDQEKVTESASALRLDVSDDGLIQLGFQLDPDGEPMFSILDIQFRFLAVRLGVELGYKINDPLRDSYDRTWTDYVQFLVDIGLSGPAPNEEQAKTKTFNITDRAGGPVKAVLRNVGWDRGRGPLGGLSGELWLPEGIEIVAARVFRLGVDEFGFFTDHNGGRYISFSGQIPMLPRALQRPVTEEEKKEGAKHGVRYQRLRFRVGGNPDAAPVLLDGLSMDLRIGNVGIKGFGAIREFQILADEYKELGFGLEVDFNLFNKHFLLGVGFFLGQVKGPSRNFRYWLFTLKLGRLPLSGFEANELRVLAAGNLHPKLPAPDGKPQAMRLLRWYKGQAGDPLSIPDDRQLTAWESEDDSWTAGAGTKLNPTISGKNVQLNLFALLTRSPKDTVFLAGLEAFLFEGKEPIGYGALELDESKIALLLVVDCKMRQLLGPHAPGWFPTARIAGTMFFCNQPSTVALGFINDTNTWPSIRFESTRWIRMEVFLGGCYQYAEGPPKVNAGGILFTAKAGKKFSVGQAQLYLSAGLLVGLWRNESQAAGLLAWIEAGIRIKLFGVFRVSVEAKIELDAIWPAPDYKRLAFELRIGTPWWLPDVTLRFQHVWGGPDPERLSTLSIPLEGGRAFGPDRTATPGILVPRLTGESSEEKAVYSIAGIRSMAPVFASNTALDALPLLSVDSTIALDLRVAVDSRLSVVGPTPPGASEQKTEEFTSRYEITSLGIRRKPRFGPLSAFWSTLLAPQSTTLGDVSATFTPQVTFHWDGDLMRAGQLDPRRLLINAATPYTLATQVDESDDIRLDDSPGWPCLVAQDEEPVWHTLDFAGTPPGRRVPRVQLFSDSNSTLHWIVRPTPVAVAFGARVPLRVKESGKIAVIEFDRPAAAFEMVARVTGEPSDELVLEIFNGLERLDEKVFPFAGGLLEIGFSSDGATSAVLRYRGKEERGAQDALEIQSLRYRTVREVLDDLVLDDLAETERDRVLGRGKLAWLPNHDYEITVTARVELEHTRSGVQEATVTQRAYFRTRGLPGLNRTARVGDEVEPYVESRYPAGPPRFHYRSEPAALVFNESFNLLAPTTVDPALPPERQQVLEWVLVAEQVGGTENARRLSRGAADWISAHRATPIPEPVPSPVLVESGFLTRTVREATTRDPILGRLERLLESPFSCGITDPRVHRSPVLMHQPVDLDVPPGAPQLWAPAQTFRLRLQPRNGPYVFRRGFTEGDETAFQAVSEAGAADAWSVTDGALTSAATGGRQYVVFGETSWTHLQIVATVEAADAVFGVAVAVGVAGTVSRALLALIDESGTTPRLELLAKRGTVVTPLAAADLPAATGTRQLHVTAFDDVVRARVGEVVIEAPRRDLREGKAALVSTGNGSVSELLVDPVDAYELVFQSSRYADFPAHIGSFGGTVGQMPLGTVGQVAGPVGTLLTAREPERVRLMRPGADPEERQRLFDLWVKDLGVAVRERPQRLEVTRLEGLSGGAEALLLESPEPLAFSEDVTLKLEAVGGGIVQIYDVKVFSNGSETHALVFPANGALSNGDYRLTFSLDRERFRSTTPNPAASYKAQAVLDLAL